MLCWIPDIWPLTPVKGPFDSQGSLRRWETSGLEPSLLGRAGNSLKFCQLWGPLVSALCRNDPSNSLCLGCQTQALFLLDSPNHQSLFSLYMLWPWIPHLFSVHHLTEPLTALNVQTLTHVDPGPGSSCGGKGQESHERPRKHTKGKLNVQ